MRLLRKQIPRLALLLATLAAAATAKGQYRASLPAVGERAPALRLGQVLQGPPPDQWTWAALRGNVVVVEFWATWCPPWTRAVAA